MDEAVLILTIYNCFEARKYVENIKIYVILVYRESKNGTEKGKLRVIGGRKVVLPRKRKGKLPK